MNNHERALALGEENADQAALMAEAVIQVSEKDVVIGPISKLDSHQKVGAFHRAFSVLLFNTKGEMLLQQRSADKVTFPNVWANACCSHPLHSMDELEEKDALGVKRAAIRKLEQELGIDPSSVSTDDMTFMTRMRYTARMNAEWIEREVVNSFDGCTDIQQASVCVSNGFGNQPRQGGSHALPATFNQMHHGVSKTLMARGS